MQGKPKHIRKGYLIPCTDTDIPPLHTRAGPGSAVAAYNPGSILLEIEYSIKHDHTD